MVTIILLIGLGIGILIAWLIYKKYSRLKQELKKLQSELKSVYIRHGQRIEHLAPFAKDFPDSDKAIFLGQPIDFITFGNDCVTFIEVKSGQAQLSPKQKRIKEQIENGKVKFEEVRY